MIKKKAIKRQKTRKILQLKVELLGQIGSAKSLKEFIEVKAGCH